MSMWYEVRCPMTALSYENDGRVFDRTEKSKREMMGTILNSNPHYKFKWETVDDFMGIFDSFWVPKYELTWREVENCIIDCLEYPWWEYGGANPYSQMDYDDWITLNKEAEEEFVNEMIEKGIYEKNKYKKI